MIYNEANFPELPRSWASLTVNDSVDSAGNSNKKLKTKDALDHGRFPVIDQGQSDTSGYSDDQNLVVEASESSPVILFGDHTRLLKQISQPFVPGADGTKLFRAKFFWDTRFVYQMLRAVKLPDKGYARHFQYLRDSVLPLPPLNEQKRIADKLDAVLARVDACRDRLDRIPAILKRFRQSVLAAATSGKLTEDWRVGNVERPTAALRDALVSIKTGPFGSSLHKSDYVAGGIPVVNPMHIVEGKIAPSTGMAVSKETFSRLSDFHLTKGDVIIGRRGEMGRCAVVTQKENGWLCGTGSMVLKPVSDLDPNYLQLFLSSPETVKALVAESVGSTMVNLNQKILLSMEIYYPSLSEQAEIVRRVEALFAFADRLEARHTAARAQVEKLTPATLAKAFRGELVPQDPNDKPASELLERIKARCSDLAVNKPNRSRKATA
ncbi:MAG: restriction endonuclease subunit S [Gallionella sp.]